MEHGNDTPYKLETFFEIAVSYNERVQQTNDIQWIIIFDETRKKEILGISKAGKWVFKDEERFFVLKDKKNFLYCVKLLEIPYIEIKANVEERFTEIMNKEGVCLSTIFPMVSTSSSSWWTGFFALKKRKMSLEPINATSNNFIVCSAYTTTSVLSCSHSY